MCQSCLCETRMSTSKLQTPRRIDSRVKVLASSTCHGRTSRSPCHGTAHRVSAWGADIFVFGDDGRRRKTAAGSTYRGAAANTLVTEASGAASIAGVKLGSGGGDLAGGAGGGHGEAGKEGEGDGGESHGGGFVGVQGLLKMWWKRWLMVEDGMGMTRWAAGGCLL